ncbi:hypothetical protein [Gordonia soli]|uniref:Peptidase M41 family protein n=1 Tax=Gordonia soli NBRC 108243 TaxID=1223545 RepID=M0QJU6_9ACTN|nr:hypothetical protein [Gordonia soli]GAC68870.1 hypothetical protein GS4_19_00600 [Gordonia soli NBRC 108243]
MTRTTRTARHPARTPAHTAAAPPTPESSTMTPAQKARYGTAIHESAHAITATVLGHTVRKITLGTVDPEHPHRLGTCVYATRFDDQDRAAICYAGPYAQAFYLHGGPPTPKAIRSALDGTEDYAAMTAAGDTRPAEVPRLVVSCWSSITMLANRVYMRGSATQADVDAALQLPRDDLDGRHHALAVIRSGSVPGSFTIVAPLP